MKKIILASQSPRRQYLTNLLKIPFSTFVCDINEENINNLSPYEYVKDVSAKKAIFAFENNKFDSVIISADTIVVCDGEILGKPHSCEEAFSMLKKLKSSVHSVYTGLTVLDCINNKYNIQTIVSSAYVHMRNYSDEEIENYIKTKEPLDKAGSYGIEGLGAILIDKIEGDYYTIVGLPIAKLYSMLKNIDIDVSEFWIK